MKRLPYLVALGVCAGPAYAVEPPPLPRPWAQLQIWGTAWDQDEDPQADPAGYGDPEADPGISLRRARVGLEGEYALVDYELSVGMGAPFDVYDTEQPLIGIIDAVAGFNFVVGPGSIRLAAGVQKVPVTREFLIPSAELLFQERSIQTEAITPEREPGLLFDWDSGFGLRTRVGLYNGNGNLFGDDSYGKLLATRIEWAKGNAYTTFTHTREDAWGVAVGGYYDDSLSTRTFRGNVDALVRFGPIAAWAEGALANVAPSDTTVTDPEVEAVTNKLSVSGQLSGFIPLFAGGIEIGARGEWYDDALSRKDNGDILIVYGGATWRDPVPGIDFGLGYIHRTELQGSTHPNDTIRMWLQVRYPTWRPRPEAELTSEDAGTPEPVEPAEPETFDKPVTPDPAPAPAPEPTPAPG